VRRFVYASSSSVYGIKDVQNVTEDLALEPLTDYSKYKAMCEDVLMKEPGAGILPHLLSGRLRYAVTRRGCGLT
jgi:UDP-glucose 4-epimerase